MSSAAAARREAGPWAVATWVRLSAGCDELAVPVAAVREVVAAGEIEPPEDGAPEGVRGVLHRGGRRLPVLDLAAHLGLAPAGAAVVRSVVVASAAGHRLALAVGGVEELLEVEPAAIQLLPPAATTERSREILGAYPWKDRWLILLDLDQLIFGSG